MNHPTTFRQRFSYGLAVVLVFVCRAAEACPGCRQGLGGDGAGGSYKTNSVALGYAVTIAFLLFMVVGIVAGLGYMMYRNCRVLAAHQRAVLQAEEDYGYGGGLPSGVRA